MSGGVEALGLPGNPVAAMVAFGLFGRPALRKMLGHPCLFLPKVIATLDGPIENRHGRRHYVRGVVRWDGNQHRVMPLTAMGAGNVFGMSQANALLEIADGVERLPAGAGVCTHLLAEGAGLCQA